MPITDRRLQADIEKLASITFLPALLDVVCASTGMGFAAVARVTEDRWIAGAVKDEIQFGLIPGGELPVKSTICHEIRQNKEPVIIDHVAHDAQYRNHHTPATYGLESYISFPLILKDGSFFGTLCAIDIKVAVVNTPAIVKLFAILSKLIVEYLDGVHQLSPDETAKLAMYADAELNGVRNEMKADPQHAEGERSERKMALLSMKMRLLIIALNPKGAFLR